MAVPETPVWANESSSTDSEYSEGRDRSRRPLSRNRSSSRTVRMVFFALAALWGFLVGISSLALVMSVAGEFEVPDPLSLALLAPLGIVAIIGGFVTASAYREWRRRRAR